MGSIFKSEEYYWKFRTRNKMGKLLSIDEWLDLYNLKLKENKQQFTNQFINNASVVEALYKCSLLFNEHDFKFIECPECMNEKLVPCFDEMVECHACNGLGGEYKLNE